MRLTCFKDVLHTLQFIAHHPMTARDKPAAFKRWLFWQLSSRLAPGPVAVTFVNNTKLLVSPGMTGATGNVYTGLHEFKEMSFVLHMLRPKDLFVDVGANIGSYTILASAVAGAASISIEPISSTFENLMQNICLNGISSRVEALCIGIGAADAILSFTSNLDTMNHVASREEKEKKATVEVTVAPLDEIINERSPRMIKIDVEGYEYEVVQGAAETLSQTSLDAVIIELAGTVNPYRSDSRRLHVIMRDYGFSPYIYSPFDRRLIPCCTKKSRVGNSLYLRNIDNVLQRLITATPFNVHGRLI
jgi:FkbM family methyltransferase